MDFVIGLPVLADFDFAGLFDKVLSILGVALGLGLVIFFHELGHFAVAKWCNVNVERFSIGFGPILWSRKRGETEYALSAIPFGGYVKMLGQDDLDPSQLSSEDIARDPRSYSSKTVGQRMGIISAGVIMNIVTGLLFFAFAFGIGVDQTPSRVGAAVPGSPAWKAGIDQGDTITRINDRQIDTFTDIMRAVALSSGPIRVRGRHEDGREFDFELLPDGSGTKRMIGVAPVESLTLASTDDRKFKPVTPGTPAAEATPPLQPGDVIREAGGMEVASVAHLGKILAERRDEPLEFVVERREKDDDADPKRVAVTIAPHRFRTLGMWMEIGQLTAIRNDSPAADAGLRPGDKILSVDGKVVGKELDPLRLPDLFAERGGETIDIRVSREVKGADRKDLKISLVPEPAPGWTAPPVHPETPVEIPAIGATFRLIPTVMHVEPEGPAAKAGIQQGERIERMRLIRPPKEGMSTAPDPVTIGPEKDKEGAKPLNWGQAFWALQSNPTAGVELDVRDAQGELRPVTVAPVRAEDWFIPDQRGMILFLLAETQQADNAVEAARMGLMHTRNTMADIYLTLRRLLTGDISLTELHGPVGIAGAAYSMARQGIAALLLFLGFLSVNLAVLNFLPIPVLDGGHMVFLIWEAVTRKRPSERVLVAATYFGMAFVLSLMMFVLYLDIFVHR
ncbi:MAG: RIP metalloprotease RseP [Planctomycetales bacterium]